MTPIEWIVFAITFCVAGVFFFYNHKVRRKLQLSNKCAVETAKKADESIKQLNYCIKIQTMGE